MAPKIEELYIFDGFSKEEITYFLLMSQTQYRKSWDHILTVWDLSNGCAYYINSGFVRVVQWGQQVALLGPGSFFGEIALITDEPRNATIVAEEDCELQVFLKDDFITLMKQSAHGKEIRDEIMSRIKQRLKK
jgi:CRP-like cAMP-binding protein